MKAKEFEEMLLSRGGDYGICPPPISDKEGLDILIKHFLGDDWYTTLPMGRQQVNSQAIYEILERYPRKSKKRFIR